ncbi:hypothetical protein AAFF_G00421640 [Aldrovandia affinis]|uniref:Uncharacterized protein n=1 Tax=Aldrovandia affinis TaxID=143900 RepID=A0AAD7WIV5_9TELE|nr:hypothetical protein AAFF_G00421640 [Aldrovandia affinis]
MATAAPRARMITAWPGEPHQRESVSTSPPSPESASPRGRPLWSQSARLRGPRLNFADFCLFLENNPREEMAPDPSTEARSHTCGLGLTSRSLTVIRNPAHSVTAGAITLRPGSDGRGVWGRGHLSAVLITRPS